MGWTDYDDPVEDCPHLPSMGGWFGFKNEETGPAVSGKEVSHRWADYIDGWDSESRACAEAARAALLERWPEGFPPGGFWHQGQTGDTDTVPLGACGGKITMSMRAWGDFVAAVMSERDDKDHTYVEFAWYGPFE